MQYPKLRLQLLLGILLLILPTLSSAEPAREPPPEPVYPERSEMSDSQFDEAWAKWRTAHTEWETNLPAGELIKLRERDEQEGEKDPAREESTRSQRLPLPTDRYSWRTAASQKKLGSDVIAALKTRKIAFGDSARQSFSPYLSGPVFITSDSVLNAFHVLFEDSFRELELHRAARFRSDFEQLLTTARKLPRAQSILAPERIEPAIRHLERVLGPALVICGTPLEFFDPTVQADIQMQVTLINGAEKRELPSWLAPADPASLSALDYSRFQPVGFYTKPARLASYFRAIRWLQLVPFRASREHEFDAMVLLACATHERGAPTHLMTAVLGRNDDPSPLELQDALDDRSPRTAESFDWRRPEVRNNVVRKFIRSGYYQINSDLRKQRTLAETFSLLTFRVVPQAALADSVLFQQLLDHGKQPSGLAVAALLGSPFATERLDRGTGEIVASHQNRLALNHREQRRQGFPPSIYDDYLHTLNSLFLPPAPEAPAFMKNDTWALKSAHTALGGWAQMRHTFTLQAKMSVFYSGLVMIPPGFVEPNPEFFAQMGNLVTKCDQLLADAQVYLPSSVSGADEYRDLCAYISERWINVPLSPDERRFAPSTHELDDEKRARWAEGEFEVLAKAQGWPDAKSESVSEFQQHLRELVAHLETKASRIERGEEPLAMGESTLRFRWQNLARIVARLEALAHKQLRGQPWTDDEAGFLKRYGEEMAYIHGYYGNSWLTPRDDAPRWAEVSGLPERGTFLAAGVGRPRTIYVLYPWNGLEILCTGSVMQYYEYEGKQCLSDEAWRDLLDSPDAPPLPTWMQPYAKEPAKPAADH